MYEVGDKKRFVPSAYTEGNGAKATRQSEVHGVITMVNEEHRWYRVTYKPLYEREQHECFKF